MVFSDHQPNRLFMLMLVISENKNSSEDADKYFNSDVLPLLQKIVKCSDVFDKCSIVESSEYSAKQVLHDHA